MSSLACKNVKIQDTNGNVASTISWDGNNVTFDKPVLVPTAPVGTKNTQVATTAFAMGAGVGSNQTWQDVKSNRALGTTYTNSTGKPIIVSVRYEITGIAVSMIVDGVTVASFYNSTNSQLGVTQQVVVPNGSTYTVTASSGSPTLTIWTELR
jgi:hypothetical protein